MKNYKKGFTLIELLVVIAIIGILASVILASLNSATSKSTDAKVLSQLKSMGSQAQLFIGTLGTAYVVPSGTNPQITSAANAGVIGAAAGGTAASGTLFNDTTTANNGLFNLISKLPVGTAYHYGWDGTSVVAGGKWFLAAKNSKGAYCVDSDNTLRVFTGTPPVTRDNFVTAFPNTIAANGYKCS